jgi:hypothetical protein
VTLEIADENDEDPHANLEALNAAANGDGADLLDTFDVLKKQISRACAFLAKREGTEADGTYVRKVIGGHEKDLLLRLQSQHGHDRGEHGEPDYDALTFAWNKHVQDTYPSITTHEAELRTLTFQVKFEDGAEVDKPYAEIRKTKALEEYIKKHKELPSISTTFTQERSSCAIMQNPYQSPTH